MTEFLYLAGHPSCSRDSLHVALIRPTVGVAPTVGSR